MEPIALLESEHRLIEDVVGALEVYCAAVENGEEVSRDDLDKFVEFLREHNDDIHHEKEERILFETMVQNGFPRDHGAIASILREHHNGRVYADALASAAATGEWTAADRERISDAARGYAVMLRPHIVKEDRQLFPTAAENLSPEAMSEVGEAFERFEAEHADRKAKLQSIAKELVERYFKPPS